MNSFFEPFETSKQSTDDGRRERERDPRQTEFTILFSFKRSCSMHFLFFLWRRGRRRQEHMCWTHFHLHRQRRNIWNRRRFYCPFIPFDFSLSFLFSFRWLLCSSPVASVAQMKTSRQSFFFVFIVVSRVWKEIVVDMRKLERILFQKSLETRNNKPLWYLISCQFFIQTKFQQLRGIHRAFWLIWWNSSSARSRTAIIDILYGSEFRCLFSHFLFYSFLLFFLCQHKYMRPKNAFG